MSNKHRTEYRKWLRAQTGAPSETPLRLVDGASPPMYIGEFGHYTTPGGKPVQYPNAYRRAWGKPLYNKSTARVEVGREWAARHNISVEVF